MKHSILPIIFFLLCQTASADEVLFQNGRVSQETPVSQAVSFHAVMSPGSALSELAASREMEILFKPDVLQVPRIFSKTRIEIEVDTWQTAFNSLLEQYFLNAELASIVWADGRAAKTIVITNDPYARLIHDAQSEDPFNYVIHNKDLHGLELLFAHGHDPNTEIPTGIGAFSFPLTAAVHGDWAAGVELSLAKGANPDILIPDTGLSPLIIAAWLKHDEVLEILLKGGADPNLRSKQYLLTALDEATWRGTEQAVRLLLEYGATPNQSQLLPSYAARRSPAVLELLIQHGLDPGKLTNYIGTDARKRDIVSQAQQKKGTGKCFEWQADDSEESITFVESLNSRYLEQLPKNTAKPVCMVWVEKGVLHLENPANFGVGEKQSIIDEYRAGIAAIADNKNSLFAQIALHFPKVVIHTLDRPAFLGIRLVTVSEIDTRPHE